MGQSQSNPEQSDSRLRLGVRMRAATTGRPDYVVGHRLSVEYGLGGQQRFGGSVEAKGEFTLTLIDRVGNRTVLRWPHLHWVTLEGYSS